MAPRLYAKSWDSTEDPPESVFLSGHLREVFGANQELMESTANDQLRAVGLLPEDWRQRFERIGSVAAAIHDLGKANDHFQGLVNPGEWPNRRGRLQGLRHEWVSLLLANQTILRDWLLPAVGGDELDWSIALWAATGHHPGYDRASPPTSPLNRGEGSEIILLTEHADFVGTLQWMGEVFGLGPPPAVPDITLSLAIGKESALARLRRWEMESTKRWRPTDAATRALVAALKASLVSADVAGSALPKTLACEEERRRWIKRSLDTAPTSEQLSQLIADRLGCGPEAVNGRLRPFQREVAEQEALVTFVKAGCGTGKTLAAYHWACNRWPGRRLYFCYPTTGTATEGFRDYLLDEQAGAGRFGADLFHSRRDVDFDVVLGVRSDHEPGQQQELTAEDEIVARIASLDAWSTPIVSCTVDTVLGLIQNHRRGLFSWPALVGAAFVFDEIHAYDDSLFGALLRFLEATKGIPVLLMTASLPDDKFEALASCVARRGGTLPVVAGPKEIEGLPRYHRSGESSRDWPLDDVRAEVDAGGKVLWVCNTVRRAMDAAARTRESGLTPIIYHSRFRYVDRVEQHRALIETFRSDYGALAICTQVAEMSLDLSATLLVTDLAPVPSLIQRLGRLNRRAERGDPARPLIVVEPRSEAGALRPAPYEEGQLLAALRWLDGLPRANISQTDLARVWEEQASGERSVAARTKSAWLDGGPVTRVGELRQGSPGITVVMAQDAAELRAGTRKLAEVALPMPPPPGDLSWRQWDRLRGIPIAPESAIHYDINRGAEWRNAN